MDLNSINDRILEDLANQHRSYFVTGVLSGRLENTPLPELIMYAYGTLAAQDEIEDYRLERELVEHEGFEDCETFSAFWRGVFDVRGTCYMWKNKRGSRSKDNGLRNRKQTTHDYPIWRISGTQLLLSRLYDFFKLYAPYPQAANDKFLEAIDEGRGKIELIGLHAQMAVFNLYGTAKIGAYIERANDIISWRPLRGWGIGLETGCIQPERAERMKRLKALKPLPKFETE